MTIRTALLASAMALTISVPALAQSNLERLGQFKTTGISMEMEGVDQSGARAAQLRSNLENISLPPGFKIDLYAVVPDARHIAVAPQGTVTFVGTRKTAVWSVTDRDRDRVADDVRRFAPSVDFTIPNGPCFSPDGFLYIVEQNRVLLFPAAEFFFEGPDVVAVPIVEQGKLIPVDEESYNHTARVCDIGPDDKLYISLGQPFNVRPAEKGELYDEVGIGGIIRMNRDGTGREVYVRGIRNSVGQDFNPSNGQLWFTDNQVDGMGDDIPPGEVNRVVEKGQNFGFPWYGGGSTRTNEYRSEEPPADLTFPEVEMVAHAADLGMMFYTGRMFPEKYRGGIFSAQHGSWNRTIPVGARIMFTSLDEEGAAAETVAFAEGWLDHETGEYLGRPVDVAQLPDGSIILSDDFAGALYRIWYEG
ncbi:MAG: sorbosone dehydrogenase [Inquilinus sp.]|nr:sorbosone dehydrogenase [Inquilinus sp.]